MSSNGWVKLHRSALESSVFHDPKIWYVWCWCLMKANHSTKKVPWNGSDIELLPGQFITGYHSATKQLRKITIRNLRTAFTYLKSTGRIAIKSNNKFSIISICNWHDYQLIDKQSDKPATNERQASDKPTTTDKKDQERKNEKNDNNNTKKYISNSDKTLGAVQEFDGGTL